MKYVILVLVASLFSGCVGQTHTMENRYPYHFAVTTGLAESITHDGRGIAIKFAKTSNKKHLFSFSRLHPEIPGVGNKIYIHGKLLPKVHYTQPAKQDAQQKEKIVSITSGEPFQYFELSHWSIELPIRTGRYEDIDDELTWVSEEKSHLTQEHFVSPIDVDLKIYEAQ